MSLRWKLAIAVFGIVVVLVVGIAFVVQKGQRDLMESVLEDRMRASLNTVKTVLQNRAGQALAVAMASANMPEVIQAALEQDRARAADQLVPIYQGLKQKFNLSVLHLRVPPDTSFLRAQNVDMFGDVTQRQAILDTASGRSPLIGFDRAVFGMGLRGWSPVIDGGEVIGTMEVNMEFSEQLLNEIGQDLGLELALFGRDGGDYLMQAATKDGLHVDQRLFEQAERGHSEIVRAGDMVYALFPVLSYEGDVLALIGVFQDVSDYMLMTSNHIQRLVALVTLIGLVCAGAVASLAGMMSRPIVEVKNQLEALAEGGADLTTKLSVRSRDEIGQLAVAFNRFIDSLNGMIREVRETETHIVKEVHGLKLIAAKSMQETERITLTIHEVAQGAHQQAEHLTETTQSIQQLGDAIDRIAAGTREQSYQVHQATELIHAMAATFESVVQLSDEVAVASEEGVLRANDGTQAVQESVLSMERIRSTTEKATERVRELGEQSRKIGDIIRMITDIAEQTNLLAINAAIEAARAGEHGRGFAIVADEVQRLSVTSAESAQQIGELVETIQHGVQDSVHAMVAVMKEVERGSELTAKAGGALEDILEAIELTDKRAQDIAKTANQVSMQTQGVVDTMTEVARITSDGAAATEQMTASSEHVGQAIGTVAAVSEETAAASEDVAQASEQIQRASHEMQLAIESLSHVAERLSQLMKRFKLVDV